MLWCNVLALHKRHGWESHCTVVYGDYVEKELGVCRGGYFQRTVVGSSFEGEGK